MFCRSRYLHQLTKLKALQVLGLESTATIIEVKKAYKTCALNNHPDVTMHLSIEEQNKREEKFKEVNVAVAYLEEGGLNESENDVRQQQNNSSPFSSGMTSEERTKKRISTIVTQLQKTNMIQHIPLPADIDITEATNWVNNELLKRNLSGLYIHAQQYGPFGTPCITIRGVSQYQILKRVVEQEKAKQTPATRAMQSMRTFVAWLKEPI